MTGVSTKNLATVQKRSGRRSPWMVVMRVAGKRKAWAHPTKTSATSFAARLNAAVNAGELFDPDRCEPVSWVRAGSGLSVAESSVKFVQARWPSLRAPSRRSLVEGVAHVIAATHPDQSKRNDVYTVSMAALSAGTLTEAQENAWLGVVRTSPSVGGVDVDDVARVLATNLDGSSASSSTVRRRLSAYGQLWEHATGAKPEIKGGGASRGTRGRVVSRVPKNRIGTMADALAVIGALDIEWTRRACYLMLYAGLRPAEAVSARWVDIDFESSVLTVEFTRPEAGSRFTDSGDAVDKQPPKWRGEGELREVLLVPQLVTLLRQWHSDDLAAANEETGTGGGKGTATAPVWVCATATGSPGRVMDLSHVWPKAREKVASGWPAVRLARPYDLRHTHASLSLSAGAPVAELAERLGHSARMLLDVYAESIPGDSQRLKDILSGALVV